MLNVQNKLGDTPLHSSAWGGHKDVVAHLLSTGFDKTVRNKEGKMPMSLAKKSEVGALLMTIGRCFVDLDEVVY